MREDVILGLLIGVTFILVGAAACRWPMQFLTLFGHERWIWPAWWRPSNMSPKTLKMSVSVMRFNGLLFIAAGVWFIGYGLIP